MRNGAPERRPHWARGGQTNFQRERQASMWRRVPARASDVPARRTWFELQVCLLFVFLRFLRRGTQWWWGRGRVCARRRQRHAVRRHGCVCRIAANCVSHSKAHTSSRQGARLLFSGSSRKTRAVACRGGRSHCVLEQHVCCVGHGCSRKRKRNRSSDVFERLAYSHAGRTGSCAADCHACNASGVDCRPRPARRLAQQDCTGSAERHASTSCW